MKAALSVLLAAGLFAAAAAPAISSIASAAPDIGVASPNSPADGTEVAPAPTPPEQPGTPPPTWKILCSPTCPYYYSFCQEVCGTRGIKSFTCMPVPPGTFGCARYTCTCNGLFP
jgi:hypothetical protein